MRKIENKNNVIRFIEDIKKQIENYNYANTDSLKEDFYKSITLVWNGLIDLRSQDLSLLYKVQEYLINNVIEIHVNENCIKDENLLEENININNIKNGLSDSKRAYDIYLFNQSHCEYYLIGDIHSDTISLDRILESTDFFKKVLCREDFRLIFLGDYVDRGKAHLKTLHYILTLKYIFPEHIFLQRGNHDGGSFNNGEVKMWVRKPEVDSFDDWFLLYLYELATVNPSLNMEVIKNCLKFFQSLSALSIIGLENKNLLLSHGGIPRPKWDGKAYYHYLKSLSNLTDDRIKDHLGKTIKDNMMWSDPTIDESNLYEDRGRFKFTEDHFEEFRRLLGFDILIRGHQVEEMGYRSMFHHSLITIFSSGSIMSRDKNINHETAYLRVSPKIIQIDYNGDLNIIDLNKES